MGWGNNRGGAGGGGRSGRNDDDGGGRGPGQASHRDGLFAGLRTAALERLRELRLEAEEFADVTSPDANRSRDGGGGGGGGARPRGPGGGAAVWALLSPKDGGARR